MTLAFKMTRQCWAGCWLVAAVLIAPLDAMGQRRTEPIVSARERPVLVYSADTVASRVGSTNPVPSWVVQSDSTARHLPARPDPEQQCRARGPIAIKGLFYGAVVGGMIGFALGRQEEYGGAAYGTVAGAVIGAPVGMVILLLRTPFTPC